MAIKAKECSQYQFIVSNAQATTYSVLVTEQDMISLPLGKEIPGILKYPKKLFQIYEIVVREKCDIRFVLKFCLCAEGRVMIHASKSSIETQEYDTLILLNEESQSEHLSYPAKPGIFYVKVECTDIGGIIEYTI